MFVSMPSSYPSDVLLSSARGRSLVDRVGKEKAREMFANENQRMNRIGELMRGGMNFADAVDVVVGVRRGTGPKRPVSDLDRRREQIAALRRELANSQRRTAHMDSRWPVAVHEAGHAVFGVTYGIPVGVASIVPDSESLGYCSDCSVEPRPVSAVLHFLFGGPAAQAWANGSQEFRVCGADQRLTNEALARLPYGDRDNAEMAARCSVLNRMPNLWPAIEAAARELIVKSWIGAEEVSAIIRSN
jgi:hypothetical protein